MSKQIIRLKPRPVKPERGFVYQTIALGDFKNGQELFDKLNSLKTEGINLKKVEFDVRAELDSDYYYSCSCYADARANLIVPRLEPDESYLLALEVYEKLLKKHEAWEEENKEKIEAELKRRKEVALKREARAKEMKIKRTEIEKKRLEKEIAQKQKLLEKLKNKKER